MKSTFARVALAVVTASAAVVGLSGPTSAATYDGLTYSFPLEGSAEGSAITGNAAATVDGTSVDAVVFASGITEATQVVMHFHTGTTCDADGGIALAIATDPVPVIGGEFVYQTTVALGATDFENVYFNVHNAAGGTVIACGTLDLGPDPQIAEPAQVVYNASGLALNGADITASGSVTLLGNRLTVNLDFEGADLREGSRHILTLRDSSVCEPGTFANLTSGLVRSVTPLGSTAPPGPEYSLLDVWNNSPWSPTPGDLETPDTLAVDTEIILTAEQAAALPGYAFILHGSESETDVSRPADRGGLTVQETIPSQCVSLTLNETTTLDFGRYYNLDFVEQNDSGISGPASLINTGAVDGPNALRLLLDLEAPSTTDASNYKVLIAAPPSLQCSGDLTEQPLLDGDNPELDLPVQDPPDKTGIDAGLGRIRNFDAMINETGFTGNRGDLVNAGEFTLLLTNNVKDQILACAQLVPALGEAPATPAPPSTTVAQATTLVEIVNATDYRPVEDAEILRLYQAFFNREPDVEGAKYWLQVSRNGRRTIQIAGDFTIASAEFKNVYADAPDNREFLIRVYDNMLSREPDAAGLNYWLDRVNGDNANGTNPNLGQISRGRAVFYVALNQEFINNYPFSPDS